MANVFPCGIVAERAVCRRVPRTGMMHLRCCMIRVSRFRGDISNSVSLHLVKFGLWIVIPQMVRG